MLPRAVPPEGSARASRAQPWFSTLSQPLSAASASRSRSRKSGAIGASSRRGSFVARRTWEAAVHLGQPRAKGWIGERGPA